MNWADWAIVGIFSLSCLFGVIRGFAREALSLIVWICALLVAKVFSDHVEVLLINLIETPSVRAMAAFALLFVATLIIGALLSYLVGALIHATGLTGTDRLLGVIFGAVRAFIIVMALIIVVPALIPIKDDAWWHQSQLIPYFVNCEDWVRATYDELTRVLANLFAKAENRQSI